MSYYDMFGWYTSASHPGREAPAPQNTSETTTPGELRANWDGYQWVMMEYVSPPAPPPPDLSPLTSKIKSIRDYKAQNGGYQVAGKWYHSDVFSRSQQIGLVILGPNIPPNLQWKTMDGSFVLMTQVLAGQIFAAAATQDAAMFAHAETLIAEVQAAQDPYSVDLYAGWPATYNNI
jgi:hypothetical protein